MEVQTATKSAAIALPAPLADVALIDAKACAAVGAMGVSWWHVEVREGRAPQPAIRGPRCTRWRLADVRAYWAERASKGADTPTSAAVIAKAKKASDAARAKRAASA